MKLQIKNRWTGELIVDGDFSSLAELVEDCVRKKLSLRDANLSDANLRDADLRAADLRAADLRAADLRDANLRGADLRDANLSAADLRDANLRGADLSGANLRDANLRDALTPIRDDVWAVLSSNPSEVPALLKAIEDGRIDGSTYSGECACLSGTLENSAKANGRTCDMSGRNSYRMAERFFLNIQIGDKPDNSPSAKLAHEWVSDWLSRVKGAFAKRGKETR